MKILHISKYYHPFRGGIEKMIMELAEGTAQKGHEVTVLCSNYSWDYKEEMMNGVRVVRLPRFSVLASQPLTFSFLWKAKKWMNWADIVQVHTPNPLAELSYLWQDNKKTMIATYHCDVVRQKNLIKLYRPVARKVLERADRVVVSTPNHLVFSEALKGLDFKSEVIPFGVRAKHAEKTLEITNHMKRIKEELGDFFLFVGRLVPYKGVDVLLKSMRDVDMNLALIGTGPRWEAWNLLAQELGVAHKVKFLGLMESDSEFAAYIHACHSLVLPSIDESEALGIVLIEAMSCSTPVVTTNLKSGVPWVNDAGVTGLQVEPKDHVGLAKALNKLATDHDLRKNMGEAARERFEKMFQIETMVKSYLDLYKDCLEAEAKAA
ncbi:MAG: glycosyltransferase [Bdellovibrionales bacterium]|nr:glycosyltransferase [Bdellovibrionales bacterium]